jgi:hypothetical protein
MRFCRSCSAPIRWGTTYEGARIPLDFDAAATGNIRWFDDGRIDVLNAKRARVYRQLGVPLYVSHFATCPNAAQHRRRKVTL